MPKERRSAADGYDHAQSFNRSLYLAHDPREGGNERLHISKPLLAVLPQFLQIVAFWTKLIDLSKQEMMASLVAASANRRGVRWAVVVVGFYGTVDEDGRLMEMLRRW